MHRPTNFGRSLCLWGPCYGVMLGAVVWSLFAVRDWAIAELSTPQSRADWQAWREDVQAEQGRPAPVQRRVPKSTEPPMLIMMRDYFGVSLAGAILFSSVLYWVIVSLITGVLTSSSKEPRHDAAAI